MLLDLDNYKSINEIEKNFSVKTISGTIYNLAILVKKYGKYIGNIIRDIDTVQYTINIKYLDHTLLTFFEFDLNCQFIDILIYNNNQTKTHLKISFKINDEPTIRYIEGDHSGYIPKIKNKDFSLKPGEYLINFAHCLLSYIGIQRVRLDDDSCLILNNSDGHEYRTKLWLYYLITKGKSWYSKFGYIPSNTSLNELEISINDVKKINLKEIVLLLDKVLTEGKNLCDYFITFSKTIIEIVKNSDSETLEHFTKTQSLEMFAELTNHLTQSIYAKEIIIGVNYEPLIFPWHETLRNLFVANVGQVNNNIKNYYCTLTN